MVYDKDVLSKKNAEAMKTGLSSLRSHHVPEIAELRQGEMNGGMRLPEQQLEKLKDALQAYHFAFNRSVEEMLGIFTSLMIRGVHPNNVRDNLPSNTVSYYASREDEMWEKVNGILLEARENVPMMMLGGYTPAQFRKAGLGDPEAYLPKEKPRKNRRW